MRIEQGQVPILWIYSKEGVSPGPCKVQAIQATTPPRNTKELNSLLCIVQYESKFMKRYAPATETLRSLLKEQTFTWEKEHQKAFDDFEERTVRGHQLTYFDPKAEHEVHVDDYRLGVSATLVHYNVKRMKSIGV